MRAQPTREGALKCVEQAWVFDNPGKYRKEEVWQWWIKGLHVRMNHKLWPYDSDSIISHNTSAHERATCI